jgi:hypothetical protein
MTGHRKLTNKQAARLKAESKYRRLGLEFAEQIPDYEGLFGDLDDMTNIIYDSILDLEELNERTYSPLFAAVANFYDGMISDLLSREAASE